MTGTPDQATASALVADWDHLPLLIGGRAEPGRGPLLPVENPATEQVVAHIAQADAGQIARAVEAADAAFRSGPWAQATPSERSAWVHAFATAFANRADEFTEAIIAELGTPIAIAGSLQVQWPAEHLRWYADQAAVDRTEDLGEHAAPVASRSEVAYRPVGVVAAITAYNYPLTLAVHKIGPVLATGCTAVLMPSPRAPIATLLLARAIEDAGLPPGVLNIVVGDAAAARQLTEHPLVRKVTFTGSVGVGRMVMRQAAESIRGVVLELGGKSPAILLDDADFERFVPAVHLRYCRNAGQACAAPTRILVPESRWDEFVELSVAAYPRIRVGDPRDPETVVGPLIDARHLATVERYVADAVAAGARVIAGGGRPDLPVGHYLNPVLLGGVDQDSPLAREELFGPVAMATPYRDVDHALALANDSDFGLHAYVYSASVQRARALAPRLRAGTISINGGGGFRPDAPMGGFGVSGIGRELGKWGIHEFLEPQHVQWAL